VSSFTVGFVTIGSTQFVATLGFTCSSGHTLPDPAAASLTLSSSATTGQCATGGCASVVAETAQVSTLLGVTGVQNAGVVGWPPTTKLLCISKNCWCILPSK
jgi:hypothetical protein